MRIDVAVDPAGGVEEQRNRIERMMPRSRNESAADRFGGFVPGAVGQSPRPECADWYYRYVAKTSSFRL